MRNDHVFYGHIGGRHPTAEEVDYHVHAARRLRAEALQDLLRNAWRSIASLFRRETPKLQHC
jgi:hypothetical protein